MNKSHILNNVILAGGPPRSGTTFLARLLNSHPEIITVIDNNVYENWSLYYYRSRVGLVQQLRARKMSSPEVSQYLMHHIVKDDQVVGAASSSKIAHYPIVGPAARPDSHSAIISGNSRNMSLVNATKQIYNQAYHYLFSAPKSSVRKNSIKRHSIPYEFFITHFRLCLKSPEIVFVLPELAKALPKASFVLVHRPIIEIAESMYRKGFEWQLASYHKRWKLEKDEQGELIAPPGVPPEWHHLWKTVSDFQRCVIYASSYLKAMVSETSTMQADKIFTYNHKELCTNPSEILSRLAKFLDVEVDGFQDAVKSITCSAPDVGDAFKREYDKVDSLIDIHHLMLQADSRALV